MVPIAGKIGGYLLSSLRQKLPGVVASLEAEVDGALLREREAVKAIEPAVSALLAYPDPTAVEGLGACILEPVRRVSFVPPESPPDG